MVDHSFHGAMQFLALVGIAVLFFTAWQRLVIDICRQRAFEIRDAALLWAHDHGRLSSSEYKDFRSVVNNSIRYYEDMTLIKVLATASLRQHHEPKHLHHEGLSFIHDQHLRREFRNLTSTLVIGLVLRSSIGLMTTMLLMPVVMLWVITYGISKPKKIAARLRAEVQADILLAN